MKHPFFRRSSAQTAEEAPPLPFQSVQTAPARSPFALLDNYALAQEPQARLYDALRESVPVIDAAILKLIRLTGGYTVFCPDPEAQKRLSRFVLEVPCGSGASGLESFICTYFDHLLTYGSAVGEILLDPTGKRVAGLYNASPRDIRIVRGSHPLAPDIQVRDSALGFRSLPPETGGRILFSALNPTPDAIAGQSLLKGLPFVERVLLRIFETTEQNFERLGNVRYAITYKPQNDGMDKAYAKERAQQIAREWQAGMSAAKRGEIADFVSIGDVQIKAIGADNQLLDTQVPVRQLLEQIIAKLGIPPFLLGLSWSTTERMSKQQADILTSELTYYRRLLSPVILRICETFLRLEGFFCRPEISWNLINLQDESEMAKSLLYRAQADQIRQSLGQPLSEQGAAKDAACSHEHRQNST